LTTSRNKLVAEARWDDLLIDGLKLLQHPDYFCFSIDAVLLANFVQPRGQDKVLDLGTGTGIIPHLLQAKQEVKQIVGIDIQPEVIKLARESASYNQLKDKLKFFHLDLRQALSFFGSESFDYIVSNPPYQKEGTGELSPNRSQALARTEIKCNLEDIVKVSNQLVKYGGQVAYVYRAQRLAELLSLMEDYNLAARRLRLIHSRQDSLAKLVLVEAVKGGGSDLKAAPPLVIYDDKGEYTTEIEEIYHPKGD
jgi:tRNA1(Val) A37 N6-methylase TrmN6